MENESRLKQWWSQLSEKLNDQPGFQQIKTKWEELDPQSKLYLKAAGGIGSVLLLLIVTLATLWSLHQLKKDYSEKSALIALIQSANEEMKHLQDSLPQGVSSQNKNQEAGAAWASFLESTALAAGIDKANLTIGPEKAGSTTDQAKETLMDVSLKKVNIKQVIRYAFSLENSPRPIKLRNLTIDTQSDPSGYLDADLSLSAFTLNP